jgi:hypothetical protein
MNVSPKTFAILSRDVYFKQRPDVDGFVCDREVSTPTVAVYKRGNQVIFAIRGTWSLKDIFSDIYLAVGRLSRTSRFKEAQDTVRHALRYYRERPEIAFTGHSMGGSIAILLALEYDTKCVGFNVGVGIAEKPNPFKAKKITIYVIDGDKLSQLSKLLPYNIIVLPKQSSNWYTNHSIETMIRLL